MIELIFVIVLLGILASIAIPKLSTTRDDAEVAKAAEEIRTFISDLTAYYTGHGRFDEVGKMTNISVVDASFNNYEGNLTTKAYYTNSARTEKCIGLQVSSIGGDLNVSVESSTSTFCSSLNRLLESSLKVHHFGGLNVSF
jgi:general secretion pathway protein G